MLFRQVLLSGFALLAASVSSAQDPSSKGALALERVRAEYDPTIRVISRTFKTRNDECEVFKVKVQGSDPVDGLPSVVDLEWYQPHAVPVLTGAAIVVPPTGGVTVLDRENSDFFCRSGIRTALVYTWDRFSEPGIDLEIHDKNSRRAISALRHVIEFTGGGPVAFFGTSLGALQSSIAMSADPRVLGAAFVVGGGPLSKILAETDLSGQDELRASRFARYGFKSREEYRSALDQAISIDTPTFARATTEPKKLLMFIAEKDTTVPTSTQWELWEAWGKPEYRTVSLSHVPTVVTTSLKWRYKIRDFIEGVLLAGRSR